MFTYRQYSMRPLEYEDLKMILEWRNSERVHSMMITDHKITWEEHCKWFERIKNNPVKLHFVFEYESRPIGYIGYSDVDEEAGTCAPSIYIGDKQNLPPDAGIIIYYMCAAYAFENLHMQRIDHFTLEKNVAAMTINKFIGFHEFGDDNFTINKNGKEELVIHLALTLEDWQALGTPLADFVKRGGVGSKSILLLINSSSMFGEAA